MVQVKKRLLEDVDISTLYSMRNHGKSNREIAEAFGVYYATIYNKIGAAPRCRTSIKINSISEATTSSYDNVVRFYDQSTNTTYTMPFALVDDLYSIIFNKTKENEKMSTNEETKTFAPIKRHCSVCGQEFNISPSEQAFYIEHGMQLPKRCIDCRASRNNMQKFVCCDCGEEFEMSQSNIEFFEQNNLFLPKRCPKCREDKRKRIQLHNDHVTYDETAVADPNPIPAPAPVPDVTAESVPAPAVQTSDAMPAKVTKKKNTKKSKKEIEANFED